MKTEPRSSRDRQVDAADNRLVRVHRWMMRTGAQRDRLNHLISTARTLTNTLGDDPLAHVNQGYYCFHYCKPLAGKAGMHLRFTKGI